MTIYNSDFIKEIKARGFIHQATDLNNLDKKIMCFCVGDKTEKKARSRGFRNTIAAEGNVENLKELILRNFDKKGGKMIYVSGETISIDLVILTEFEN